jgi:hypothetical protein
LLLAMAFWAYVRREWLVMTIFIALAPTARPEGFGFLVLAAIALIVHRRWWWMFLLPLPLLIWTYAGWRIYGRPIYAGVSPGLCWLYWLKHEWPYSQTSTYAAGPLLHFIVLLPALVSPLVFPFVAIGAWQSVDRSGWRSDHVKRCQLLIAAIPLMILAGHTLLYWRGRMASNGELRYLLIVAPLWGLLAAKGWEWTFERFHWRGPFLWAGVAALLPVLANVYYPVLPLYTTVDGEKARAVASWYRSDRRLNTDYPRILASNPEVAYYMGVSHTDAGWTRDWRKETVAKAPAGTVLVWDPVYGQFNADADRVITLEEIERAGWVERPDLAQPINDVGDGPQWRVFFSPVSIFGKKSE